jgi:3'-5' exonuclease
MDPRFDKITIDIETIPSQKPDAAEKARGRITAPANYKDPEKIAAYIEAKAAEAWQRTALDAGYGEIVCIGYALGDEEPATALYRDYRKDSERELLETFWDMIAETLLPAPRWIGHRVAWFDLRFIWRRSVVLGVEIPQPIPFDEAPWSLQVCDTSYMWSGEKGGIKLGDLCDILGITNPKEDLDGSRVWEYVEAGRIHDVADYCIADVEAAREAYQRMVRVTPWLRT